jgi:hypothetical protein
MPVQLRVYLNPYASLDGDGNPAGLPELERSPGYYLGGRIETDGPDPTVGEMLAGAKRAPRRHYKFDPPTIHTVPATGYWQYLLRDKTILPADEQTARIVGVLPFVPPALALTNAKALACEKYQAETGKSAACEGEPLWMRATPSGFPAAYDHIDDGAARKVGA